MTHRATPPPPVRPFGKPCECRGLQSHSSWLYLLYLLLLPWSDAGPALRFRRWVQNNDVTLLHIAIDKDAHRIRRSPQTDLRWHRLIIHQEIHNPRAIHKASCPIRDKEDIL